MLFFDNLFQFCIPIKNQQKEEQIQTQPLEEQEKEEEMTTHNYDSLSFDPHNTKQWLFRRLTGVEAEQALHPTSPGTFLIRKSGRKQGSYVMSIRVKSNEKPVNHIYIDVDRGQQITYIFGSNRFQRIHLLLGYYARNEIPNVGVKLEKACPEINIERPRIRRSIKNSESNFDNRKDVIDKHLKIRRSSQAEAEEKGYFKPNTELQSKNTKFDAKFDRDQLIDCHRKNCEVIRDRVENSYRSIGKFEYVEGYEHRSKVSFDCNVKVFLIVRIKEEDKCNVWATPKQLSNEDVILIRQELNEFKKGMLVHSSSKQYTRMYK